MGPPQVEHLAGSRAAMRTLPAAGSTSTPWKASWTSTQALCVIAATVALQRGQYARQHLAHAGWTLGPNEEMDRLLGAFISSVQVIDFDVAAGSPQVKLTGRIGSAVLGRVSFSVGITCHAVRHGTRGLPERPWRDVLGPSYGMPQRCFCLQQRGFKLGSSVDRTTTFRYLAHGVGSL
jgi:hypothetical protein